MMKTPKGAPMRQTGAPKWTLLLLLLCYAVCRSGFCQAQTDLGPSQVGDRVFREGVASQSILNLTEFMSAHHIQGRELLLTVLLLSRRFQWPSMPSTGPGLLLHVLLNLQQPQPVRRLLPTRY
ncbi:hypothetical protein KFL_005960065 [Klebsormidium nitens]|uniref:Uncharacterized protein n=1 Tax=Klebsormidium nitens TaxID=105231 RepID=A0A1Y1IPM2_KLENI|nr:hypothetical protein KFL_005960065 [Klebsormidium nitens]|eukprot:GAQ90078.1 hypothetical protein KFL_005960065 [Klebsormidium nitens]